MGPSKEKIKSLLLDLGDINKNVSLYRCSLYKFLNLAILPVCITMFMTKIKLHILHHNTSNCKPTLIYFIFNISEYIFLTKLWLLCFLWRVLVHSTGTWLLHCTRAENNLYTKDPHTSRVFVWDKLNGAVIFFRIEGGQEKSGGHIIFSWKVGGHKNDWVATNFTKLGFLTNKNHG